MSSDLVDIALASARMELKAIEEDLGSRLEMGEEIPESLLVWLYATEADVRRLRSWAYMRKPRCSHPDNSKKIEGPQPHASVRS